MRTPLRKWQFTTVWSSTGLVLLGERWVFKHTEFKEPQDTQRKLLRQMKTGVWITSKIRVKGTDLHRGNRKVMKKKRWERKQENKIIRSGSSQRETLIYLSIYFYSYDIISICPRKGTFVKAYLWIIPI